MNSTVGRTDNKKCTYSMEKNPSLNLVASSQTWCCNMGLVRKPSRREQLPQKNFFPLNFVYICSDLLWKLAILN